MNVTIHLAPLEADDMPAVRLWRNDWSIWRWARQDDMISESDQRAWFDHQAKDPATRMYKILIRNDEGITTVGVCGFSKIDRTHGTAEFSIYLAPRFQKRGIGGKALQVLVSHGFSNIGLRQIWGETFEGNPAAKVFEKAGFKKDGTRRQFYWKDGGYVNVDLYSIIRDEAAAAAEAREVQPHQAG